MSDFLKKAKDAAGKALDVAGKQVAKAKEFVGDATEVVKLEWELVEKKQAYDNLLLQYGRLCYEEASEEEKEACMCAIGEAKSQIAMLEENIKNVKEEARKKEAEKNTVFCTNCGEKYEDKEKFCSKCGTKLKK